MIDSIDITFSQIAPWLLPPLLGALIGYLTNALAIRMLFRPLREVRVFGVPIPLTPGVIPRRREELAESIGRMVARDLLTPDVFEERFGSEGFRYTLRRGIGAGITTLSRTTLEGVETKFRGVSLLESIQPSIAEIIAANDSIRQGMIEFLTDAVTNGRSRVFDELDDRIDRMKPLSTLTEEQIERMVRDVWPSITDIAGETIREPAVQSGLDTIVQRVLAHTLDQLNRVQRFVVVAGQYDRSLLNAVPSIVSRATSEIIAFLESTTAQRTVVDRIVHWVEARRERSIGEMSPESFRRAMLEIVEETLNDRDSLYQTIEELIDPVLYQETVDAGVRQIVARIRRYTTEHPTKTIGEVAPLIPQTRGLVARRTAGWGASLLTTLAPRIVGGLNVHDVVVQRINTLDIETVEGLLLGIIKKHLRWINIFGALIGALIGGSQIALRLVGW